MGDIGPGTNLLMTEETAKETKEAYDPGAETVTAAGGGNTRCGMIGVETGTERV